MNDRLAFRKLELADTDAAAIVHRAALLSAMPMFGGLHALDEDRRYLQYASF